MSCCSKKRVEKRVTRKYKEKDKEKTSYKMNMVHPAPRNYRVSNEFTETLMSEVILCGSCQHAFSLRSNEIVGNCGGCNKFLHCGIAGKCVGPNCSIKVGNEVCRLTWCYDCVPKNFLINLGKNNINGDCLCLECSTDENVPKMYKRKM